MAKSQYTHDVVASNGEYSSNGEKKKRYIKIGKAFTDDSGRISIKLDSIPVGPEWSGWISLYEPRHEDQPQRQQQLPPGRRVSPGMPSAPPVTPDNHDDDDIPF